MVEIALQAACVSLFTIGAWFVFLELRARHDKIFLYFGLALMLICFESAVDLWILPAQKLPAGQLFWIKAYHIVACGIVVFVIYYLMLLCQMVNRRLIATLVALSSLFSLLFCTNLFLVVRQGHAVTTPLYTLLFAPYMVGCFVIMVVINTAKLIAARGDPNRRTYALHLAGLTLVVLGAVVDMLTITIGTYNPHATVLSSVIIGTIGYGVILAYIFTERFIKIIEEKGRLTARLTAAYLDLEQANALKELGESTAIVNHEIKNCMHGMGLLAEVLQKREPLSEDGKGIIGDIIATIRRLQNFSQEVLALSRAHVLVHTQRVDICEIIRQCIRRSFPGREGSFMLEQLGEGCHIKADPTRIEQVFVNLFGNAIDAAGQETPRIAVRCTTASAARQRRWRTFSRPSFRRTSAAEPAWVSRFPGPSSKATAAESAPTPRTSSAPSSTA
jgi:signal transduction histidine kinase